MNFFEESYVMPQVGKERVLGEFGVLDFSVIAERPKSIERVWASARRINTEASVANESSSFGEKVGGRLVERFFAAAASFKIEIVAPHVACV